MGPGSIYSHRFLHRVQCGWSLSITTRYGCQPPPLTCHSAALESRCTLAPWWSAQFVVVVPLLNQSLAVVGGLRCHLCVCGGGVPKPRVDAKPGSVSPESSCLSSQHWQSGEKKIVKWLTKSDCSSLFLANWNGREKFVSSGNLHKTAEIVRFQLWNCLKAQTSGELFCLCVGSVQKMSFCFQAPRSSWLCYTPVSTLWRTKWTS